jgi:glycosyltransferase involved in cell wall biosynthesis
MRLSVIIPTRDRAALLERALNSLLNQTLSCEHFEVIVVDNGSTDNTFAMVSSFKTRLTNLRYLKEDEPGLHVGRHRGFFTARSDLLVYADDDIEALPTWLNAIEDSFKDEKVVLVGGKCLPKFESQPPEWLNTMWSADAAGERILGYLSLIDLGDVVKQVNPDHIYGCNYAVRRSVLQDSGGFHPDAMPQDLIRFRGDGESYVCKYVRTRGLIAMYNPLAAIFHWVPVSRMTTGYFCCRAYNQGISDSYSAVRLAGGVGPESGGMRRVSLQLRNQLLPVVSGVVSRISRYLTLFAKVDVILEIEGAVLRRMLAAAYQSGYAYHQSQVRESPDLLAWVLKSDYWDYHRPASTGNGKMEDD